MSKIRLSFIISQIIPSYKYDISTAMTKSTVLKTVKSNSGSVLDGAAFGATVTEYGFTVRPNSRGIKRLAPPMIEATVGEENGATNISYHAHIVPFYRICSIFVLCLFAFVFLLSLTVAIIDLDTASLITASIALLWLILTETIIQLTFWHSIKKTLKVLDYLLIL